ncbi:MAG: deaminase [Candidatus Micrarchaeota archaeon]
MIIGITGKNCAGKDSIAQYLQEKKGFHVLSLSDVIRDELADKGMLITRENLIEKANQMRKMLGAGILAKKVVEKIERGLNYVIVSIRNPKEVAELRKLDEFNLLHVDADARIRFERMKKRQREGDPQTFEAFLYLETAEAKNIDPSKQQLDEVINMADGKIENNTSLQRLYESVDVVLGQFSQKFKPKRPSWDEYFIEIAKVVASRSNCSRRKIGAVIVKDKRIISTGYNGTPRGVKNCNEGGCPRCNSPEVQSGKDLEECFCCHAEENSIVMAAYHGISLKGGTVYTTFSPCLYCTRMIINSGIKEVVYNQEYSITESSIKLLKEAGVVIRKITI